MSQVEPLSAHSCECQKIEREVAEAVAAELVGLTRSLSDLAFDLGNDPVTVRKHMASLQAIDLITQIHLALSDLLASPAPLSERLNAVPVEALADRLSQRLGLNSEERMNDVGDSQDEMFVS